MLPSTDLLPWLWVESPLQTGGVSGKGPVLAPSSVLPSVCISRNLELEANVDLHPGPLTWDEGFSARVDLLDASPPCQWSSLMKSKEPT